MNEENKKKWYFRSSALVVAFLCVGPLMLPLIWFNPHLSRKTKIISSVIVVVLSYYMILLCVKSMQSIKQYYRGAFEGYF